jgi:hypothetical protein
MGLWCLIPETGQQFNDQPPPHLMLHMMCLFISPPDHQAASKIKTPIGYYLPVETRVKVSCPIPVSPWYLTSWNCLLLSGLLPFGTTIMELYYVFIAVAHEVYYNMNFLFYMLIMLADAWHICPHHMFLASECCRLPLVVGIFLLLCDCGCLSLFCFMFYQDAIVGGLSIMV